MTVVLTKAWQNLNVVFNCISLTANVLATFLVALTKDPARSNLRETGLVLTYSSRGPFYHAREDADAGWRLAAHTVSALRKQGRRRIEAGL